VTSAERREAARRACPWPIVIRPAFTRARRQCVAQQVAPPRSHRGSPLELGAGRELRLAPPAAACCEDDWPRGTSPRQTALGFLHEACSTGSDAGRPRRAGVASRVGECRANCFQRETASRSLRTTVTFCHRSGASSSAPRRKIVRHAPAAQGETSSSRSVDTGRKVEGARARFIVVGLTGHAELVGEHAQHLGPRAGTRISPPPAARCPSSPRGCAAPGAGATVGGRIRKST